MREPIQTRAHRAVRRQRLRTIALTLLGAFLVMDSSARSPGDRTAAPVDLVPNEIAPARIEDVLRSWNPSLDDHTLGRIASAVERYSEQYGLEAELVAAVIIVESSVRPWAYSAKGAVGLMQVMPHMIAPLGLAGNAATIESNIEAGCWILAHNIRRLGEERGISAYFWGSNIRNLAYLEKVREARETIRRRTS
ncbi:MAG: lytic transglycosylase domain-containing protein [Myxococcota bacterium]|nr:lytic transglycosylase domain-containing protein [Myxococcota bacterium]